MPAKSKQQFKYVYAMRNKYGSKKKAPKNMKWAFDKEWTDVSFKDLPKKIKESCIYDYVDFLNEVYFRC
jgi:hypothetical protein